MFLLVHSALDTRTREIRQSRDMTRMSLLKGNAILIFRVLFYRTGCICVKVVAKYSFSVPLCFNPQGGVFD